MFTETTRYPGQQETGAYILITTLKKTTEMNKLNQLKLTKFKVKV